MANFAVRLVHGPGWDPLRQIRDQDGWDEHAAFMDGLVDDGFVILGGPVGDGAQIQASATTCLVAAVWSSMGARSWVAFRCNAQAKHIIRR